MAVRDKRELPPMPTAYLLYYWRRLMSTSWQEAMITPLSVVLEDIQMAQLEDQYLKPQGNG